MSLIDLRTEVLNRGFDPALYSARINQFINDGLMLIARRVDYYENEATHTFNTVSGTATYSWPTGLARIRSLFDTNRNVEMQYASIRDIDASPVSTGAPVYYALVGQSVSLYPTPNGVYPLELRYWAMPATLTDDNDEPGLPDDWKHLLWVYATWQCYEAEDDPQMGQYWEGRFNRELAMFSADAKFPDTDGPTQASSMWDRGAGLAGGSWSASGGGL